MTSENLAKELLIELRELQIRWGLVAITATVDTKPNQLRLTIAGDQAPVLTLADDHENVMTLHPEILV